MSPCDSLTVRSLTVADRDRWDSLLRSLPQGCFMQSWAWSQFKQLEGYQIFRYGVFEQDTLVGGCIFYFYAQAGASQGHSASLLLAPGAPCFLPNFASVGMKLLMAQATQLAQAVGAIACRMEPLLPERADYLQGFVRAPVDLLPTETLLIDLRPALDEILQAMKPKGRYNVRLSQKHGVETHFNQELQAIPKLYDLFWETVERQKFFGEPYGFFINLCQSLFAADMAEIGLATWQGNPLAAMLVVYWGDRATYLYGGRSAQHPQVMAAYALHWAAMQQAKARGCQIYDFYGYSQQPEHNYFKFSQFKCQFGGTPVTTIGAQDYFFYDRLADTLIGVLNRVMV
ncbi:MAG: peptidoglycan bridge formation glycyltransferase FemA/FemB family protein [Scytolyngbya sp. HA4215-MV1]|nr:peptidoglycan bridge formation glycyltransferase FemA/FemB family protein [Scytolyngbya sp. HA4215-MV1]